MTKSLSPSAWIRNIYTAEYNESIAGIGTFIYEDCDYEAYVYVNDELCYSQEGNFSQAGYRTIKLKEYISVTQGDIFRIDLKLKSRNHNNISITLQDTTHYKSISKENQSFIPGLKELAFELGAMVAWQPLASAPLTVTSFPSALPLLVTVTHSV